MRPTAASRADRDEHERQIAFQPFPLLGNPHLQTIVGARVSFAREPPSSTLLVTLSDGDRLALEVSTPPGWTAADRTALLLHGLCGCHRSAYLVRIAHALWSRGVRAVRMNLRGCGSGRGLARHLYHSGRSEDALAVIEELRRESPDSGITAVGYSLGGNIVLKLAGELGERAAGTLEGVIAVCPPVDLMACSRRFALPINRMYERYFVRQLRADVAERHRRFPELGPVELPRRRLSLFEFDDIYTAPQNRFRDANDYYTRASAARVLRRIRVPARILVADDDPLIDSRALADADLPETITVARTRRGGHLGFLGAPGHPGGFRWLDWQVLSWIEAGRRG